jgi:hypothetical protein
MLFAGLTTLVGIVDPSRPGFYPTCPVKALTGLNCPGCGALRSVHALVHGDLSAALHFNAALMIFLPILLVTWLRAMGGRPPLAARWSRTAAVTSLALLAAWTVARNLPFVPFNALAL